MSDHGRRDHDHARRHPAFDAGLDQHRRPRRPRRARLTPLSVLETSCCAPTCRGEPARWAAALVEPAGVLPALAHTNPAQLPTTLIGVPQ